MKPPVDAHGGKRFRHRRWMIGMTQQQLADKAGVNRGQIADIEAGRNIRGLPEDLARTMLEHAGHEVVLGDDFDGRVEI